MLLNAILLLFFSIGLEFLSSTSSSTISQSKLTGIQAKHIYNLFEDGKIGVVLDFRQNAHSSALLFSLGHANRKVFSLSSEKFYSTATFTMRLGNEEFRTDTLDFNDDFHRLNLQLEDGRFQLIVDCVKVAEGNYNYKAPSNGGGHKKSLVRVGFGTSKNEKHFPGAIREFSVDLPQASSMKCAELAVAPHLRVHRSLVGGEEEEDAPNALLKDNATAIVSLEEAQQQDTNSLSETLEQRLKFVEHQFQTIRAFTQSLDNRLKSVELHQRGCVLNGKRVLSFGEKHQSVRECAECQCSVSGQLHCGPIGCPHLKCAHPIRNHTECCPHCGKQCYYNGAHYEHGHEIWPKQCVRCRCDDGRMACTFHRSDHCPQLACPDQEIPPNQCCPVCVNRDHCSAELNPCHANATCESGQFGAQCTCKSGFFGNGTTCYDIDECLWDDMAREQLGGCQAGTICINLAGSFKCDCLPGFQRLDNRTCLDLIRL